MERALMCPQCNAPLAPSKFAKSVVCTYCGATVVLEESSVSAADFHQAFRIWNSPQSYNFPSWISLGDSHWAVHHCIAHGDISDVYRGQRARWPTELVILKVLREAQGSVALDREWTALQSLQRSQASGADVFSRLLPQPVLHGEITAGQFTGQRVSIFRWEGGFIHSLEEVLRAYPKGIAPRASIWLWRRILETLSFIHASGMVHGAILPSHVLIQENDHGARLVGYGCAGRTGEKLSSIPPACQSYYQQTRVELSVQLDLAMSARCMAAVLGGDPATASLPASVPEPLAAIVQRVARVEPSGRLAEDAWTIRESLGQVADRVFGPPQFIPIVMPPGSGQLP